MTALRKQIKELHLIFLLLLAVYITFHFHVSMHTVRVSSLFRNGWRAVIRERSL